MIKLRFTEGLYMQDIQNPKHVPKIWFTLSNHISAEALIENMHYKTEIDRKCVYAFADIQNPKTHTQNMVFPKQSYVSRRANRKDAL